MSQSTAATESYIKLALENAPSEPGRLAADLAGWWTADKIYLCARCAGRMMARGCRLPIGSVPTWKGEGEIGNCFGCRQ